MMLQLVVDAAEQYRALKGVPALDTGVQESERAARAPLGGRRFAVVALPEVSKVRATQNQSARGARGRFMRTGGAMEASRSSWGILSRATRTAAPTMCRIWCSMKEAPDTVSLTHGTPSRSTSVMGTEQLHSSMYR